MSDPTALLIGVDAFTKRTLLQSAELPRLHFETVNTSEQALRRLDSDSVDALIIGPLAGEPIAIAQQACRRQAHLAVMIVTEPERYQEICGRLQFSPFISAQTRCQPLSSEARVVQELQQAIDFSRTRRKHARTLQSASARLASSEAPPRRLPVLDRLLELAPVGVVELDGQGRFRALNPAAMVMLSIDEGAPGRDFESLLPEEARRKWREVRAAIQSAEAPVDVEFELCPPSSRVVHAVAASLADGCMLVLTDFTERVRLERERSRHVEELTQALHARDVFLSVAAHELNTPLTSLTLQLQLLEKELSDSPRVLSRVQTGRRQVGRLKSLISSLLDVSRLMTGQLSLSPERLDLAQLAEAISLEFAAQAELVGSELTVEAEEPIVGEWDRLRLEQVFGVLLSNAVKYGAGKPIRLRVARKQGRALIEVCDKGPGVAPEAQERIFQRFERAVSEQHYGGLGLGLFIAREIVHAHGGKIGVRQPEAGSGAIFAVELPLSPRGA